MNFNNNVYLIGNYWYINMLLNIYIRKFLLNYYYLFKDVGIDLNILIVFICLINNNFFLIVLYFLNFKD